MRCFKVTVEYDGTDFAGFQLQDDVRTVQGELEAALRKLTGDAVRVHGAGRTDAGVHALGQVVSFHVETSIPLERMPAAMNSVLRSDATAVAAREVDERFHARFSAKSRAYVYVVLNRPLPSAIYGRYTCHWPYALDVEAMNVAARYMVGRQDFAAWANSLAEARTTVRTIKRCAVRRVGAFVLLMVEADAFLHGMVRNIAGTLLQVGGGRRAPDDIAEITRSCDRRCAGPCAPARGLCMVRVRY
jgi:tRNA pseudouridine38-40 synthase